MSPVVRGLRQEAVHGAVEESLRVDEVHAFEAGDGGRWSGDGREETQIVLFFPQIAFCYRRSYFKSRGWVIAEFLCLFWGEGVI